MVLVNAFVAARMKGQPMSSMAMRELLNPYLTTPSLVSERFLSQIRIHCEEIAFGSVQ